MNPNEINNNIAPTPEIVSQPADISSQESTSDDLGKQGKNKTVLFLIFSILLLVISISSLVFVLIKYNKNVQNDTQINSDISNNKNSNIAYIQKDSNDKLIVYNPETNNKIDVLKDFDFNPYTIVDIGDWSPTGQYLPIVVKKYLDDDYLSGLGYFYFYNSKDDALIQVLYASDIKLDEYSWTHSGYLDFVGRWLNDTDFLIDSDDVSDAIPKKKITYVNTSKEIKDYIVSLNDDLNDEISLKYIADDYSFKIKGNTSVNNVYDFKYKGVSYVLPFEGSIPSGVFNDNLATLYKPKQINLLDIEYDKSMDEFSEEELNSLIFPKGDELIVFSDTSGKKVKEIKLDNEIWTSISLTINDENDYMLVLQTEKSLSPKKERYLKVTKDGEMNAIYEGLHIPLVKGNNILESNNRKSIVVRDSETSYSFINIETKEKSSLCDNCTNIKVNNPWIPRIVY